MPAKKGTKFNEYTFETKVKAIRLHIEEGWTYRRLMEKFGIADRHRLKEWMRKYKELGEFGLMDQRGRRKKYIDQDRYVQKPKRENDMLKSVWKSGYRR